MLRHAYTASQFPVIHKTQSAHGDSLLYAYLKADDTVAGGCAD